MTAEPWIRIVDAIGPKLAEGAADRDASDVFVADHYPTLGEHGLITMLVPAELGGGGATHSATVAALRRLAAHDPSTALALSMHQHLVAAQVFQHRAGHDRATTTLRRVAADDLVLVSTGARDWLGSNGSMIAVDGGYRLTARKAFASGSPVGSVAVTSAPFEHPTEGWQVLHFAVPLSADGVRLRDDWQAHGMRSTGSQTIVMEDVFVPDDAIALVRPRDGFHGVWNVVLTVAIPLITAVYVGIADRASEIARSLLRGQADDATTAWSMGELDSQRLVADLALHRATALANDLDFEPTLARTNEALILKTTAVEAARLAVEAAMEAVGGRGFHRRTGLEKLLRDVRAGHYHPLPRKEQRQLTGRLALGLDPVRGTPIG